MHDAAKAADRIELGVLRKLERLYPAAVSPLMKKHKQTFEKLARLEKDGAYGRARVLLRRSGLADDIASSLAKAGAEAADLVRREILGVKEAVSDEQTDAG